MEGYDAATYGDRFVDVYDDWYGSITDTDACVAALATLTPTGGRVLELGVGTGRLAIPLAALGFAVTGVDASAAMLDRLAAKPGGDGVDAVLGDMAAPEVTGPFDLAFVAYNTLFNLVGDGEQQRCLASVASVLEPGGRFVVEAFVPDPSQERTDRVTPKRVTADHVVLHVTTRGPSPQEVLGQFVDITEAGIKLRPWHIRWSTPAQLDDMAAAAGLELEQRWQDWSGRPFDADAPAHVSVYRTAPAP
ncbi:MAG TPA: class I SAM-dependent methyltransferase [Aquihabitans sp.]|jgi:SAM-dependent methyltransferase|nr:class I SAM-dependent methyltransferase [Aquihabitans sp.]